MGEYQKIGENLYKNKNHHYLKKICSYCNNEFFCRKDKLLTKKTCNKKCYQNLIEKDKSYIIDNYINDIITGSLLSDGCINNSNNGKNYFWTHTSINEDYIDYIISETNLNLSKKFNKEKEFYYKNKKYKSKKNFYFKSKSSVSFTNYKKLWYKNRIKVVPENIKITPTVLLHWYLGDGSISRENGITLCTDSFSSESINYLMYELSNLKFLPMLNYLNNRIIIPNKRVKEFLNLIGNCPVKSFEYKWETFISESYINRICKKCNNYFDASCNNQKFCCSKCAITYSNKNCK